MEPLQLLLVNFHEEWRSSLTQSLLTSGYVFKINSVSNKKQALQACSQAKYDVLLTSSSLPDGSPEDLTRVLGNTLACLVLRENRAQTSLALLPQEFIYSPVHTSTAWMDILKEVLRKWENRVALQISRGMQNQRSLYDKVAARCATELYRSTENRIENTLKIVLDVLEVSRVYIREMPLRHSATQRFICEVSAPGQSLLSGALRSVYEVPIPQSFGHITYLGVEDLMYQRSWDKAETDLLRTIAVLLKENRTNIRNKISMYGELSMSA